MGNKSILDSELRDVFSQTNLLLISDPEGKVLYYEDFNDEINMLRYENVVGRTVFELYPFFRREDFTLFKAMDTQQVIVNQLQQFEINGVPKKVLNSAYPLINDTGLVGGIVMRTENHVSPENNHSILRECSHRRKQRL